MDIPVGIAPSTIFSKNDRKEFWFDCEATDKDPFHSEITQISGYLCGEEFNIFARPTGPVNPEALEVQGKTLEEVMSYQDPLCAFYEFISLCNRHIDLFNPKDKATVFGFNVNFDMTLLFNFFRKHSPDNGKYKKYNVGNYFIKNPICVLNAYVLAVEFGLFPVPENYKLKTLCEINGIEFKAHDALEDISATRKLFDIIKEAFYALRK